MNNSEELILWSILIYTGPCQTEGYFKDFTYLFLQRGEEKEKEKEKSINVWLPLACPILGTWPTTQACALTGNRTSDPLVYSPVLSPLSHTSQGMNIISFMLEY